MTTEVVRRLSPEEEELAAKRKELARLEAELADRELALASLRAELAAFEGLYLRRVGVLYAELDEWNARLTELRAERSGTAEAQTEAEAARSQAQESYSTAHGEAADVQPFSPTPELKGLYRKAAKRVHPDTATGDEDRVRRERLMKEVNAAYAAGDEGALRRVLADLENSPDAIQGVGVGADLVRVLRQLRRVRDRISAIQVEIVALSETDFAKLKAKADFAATEERDLLEEMEASLRSRLSAIRQQFEVTTSGGHQGKNSDHTKNSLELAPSASSLARIGTTSLAQRGLCDLQKNEDADQWLQKASESFSETVEKMTPFLKLGIEKMQEYFESKVYRDLMADYISFLRRAVAASPDYPKALYELAKAYLKGFGVEVDGAQALSLLRRASVLASADELWMMSFDISEGVREKILNAEDLKEAERFCRRAADQGHAGGQYSLAAMYARGGLFADGDSGLPHSRDLAMYWLRKAAENGEFPPAENEIRHLWKRSRRRAK